MIDLSNTSHHPAVAEISVALSAKMNNDDLGFYRNLATFFLSTMASNMQAEIHTELSDDPIPVNNYCLALATSGVGKGTTVGIMERVVLKGFRTRFLELTMPASAEMNLGRMASKRSAINGSDFDEELKELQRELDRAGTFPYVSDDATAPALKANLRPLIQLSGLGAVNLQVDEIARNFSGVQEMLTPCLDLYDMGHTKNKLTKNTTDNKRGSYLEAPTPTNLLLIGTPTALLDGGRLEQDFYALLDTGYARRLLFSYGQPEFNDDGMSGEEFYRRMTAPSNNKVLHKWAQHFTQLADMTKAHWVMQLQEAEGILLATYQLWCIRRSVELEGHADIVIHEMKNRHFKALKLAGTFAFIDESPIITQDHLMSAFLLVEESGDAFNRLMKRERNYMRLARFIASKDGQELTHAAIMEDLPFFKVSASARQEMLDNANAWAFDNNIVLKRRYQDGVELFSGTALKETNLEDIHFTYSTHYAFNYGPDANAVRFDQLDVLATQDNLHWCVHEFVDGHRLNDNAIAGFDLLVLDVDGGTPIQTAQDLLADFTYMIHTTKRHTDQDHRYRIVLPMSHFLKLSPEDYSEFMETVYEWMPFKVDTDTKDIARKWATYKDAKVFFNSGTLVDVIPFIPKTTRNVEYAKEIKPLASLPNLERWFAKQIAVGNRNHSMVRYALALVDAGKNYVEIEKMVLDFNSRLSNSLDSAELKRTVLTTVATRLQERQQHAS